MISMVSRAVCVSARVHEENEMRCEPSGSAASAFWLNFLTWAFRSSPLTLPSIRQTGHPLNELAHSWMTSIMVVNSVSYEREGSQQGTSDQRRRRERDLRLKMRTLCPRARSSSKRRSRTNIFPDALRRRSSTTCSPVTESLGHSNKKGWQAAFRSCEVKKSELAANSITDTG